MHSWIKFGGVFMTTITLELPDDLAKQLQKLDLQTLINLLRQFLRFHSTEWEQATDDKFEFTILPPNPADDDFVLLPSTPLPEFKPPISKEEWKKQLLTISQWTEEEISEIEKAREYVNQWQPKAFF
jgi:hypothetical protein